MDTNAFNLADELDTYTHIHTHSKWMVTLGRWWAVIRAGAVSR